MLFRHVNLTQKEREDGDPVQSNSFSRFKISAPPSPVRALMTDCSLSAINLVGFCSNVWIKRGKSCVRDIRDIQIDLHKIGNIFTNVFIHSDIFMEYIDMIRHTRLCLQQAHQHPDIKHALKSQTPNHKFAKINFQHKLRR